MRIVEGGVIRIDKSGGVPLHFIQMNYVKPGAKKNRELCVPPLNL